MKEQFINCYPLYKTLRFSLIPVGKTEDNFNKKLLLESDKQRAENYENVQSYIDRFHKEYIKSALANARIEKINEYVQSQKTEYHKRKYEKTGRYKKK